MGTDPLPLAPAAVLALSAVATATITTVLLKKGLRNVWLRGTRPLTAGQPPRWPGIHAALCARA